MYIINSRVAGTRDLIAFVLLLLRVILLVVVPGKKSYFEYFSSTVRSTEIA